MKLKLGDIPYYPYLFCVAFVLGIYTKYVRMFEFQQVLLPLMVVFLFSAVTYLVFHFVIRDVHKRAFIIASLFGVIICFSKVTSMFAKIGVVSPQRTALEQLAVLVFLLIFLAALCRIRKVSSKITVLFNVMAIVMVLVPVVNCLLFLYEIKEFKSTRTNEKVIVSDNNTDYKPNIYHLILDEYPISEILSSQLDFDNSGFIGQLEELGFFVPKRSHSNYSKTILSLPSLLNYRYLTEAELDSYEKGGFRLVLLDMLKDILAFEFLDNQDYTTITTTAGNIAGKVFGADIEYRLNDEGFNRFYAELVSNTPFRLLHNRTKSRYDRIFYAINTLKQLSKENNNNPFIVYSHILLPHAPICMDENLVEIVVANDLILTRESPDKFADLYRKQLTGLNRMILDLVREIQDNSEVPPIIIIQGDHGLRDRLWGDNTKLSNVLDFGSFNALCLPGYDYSEFSDDISLVNTYRYIFNHYFGADLGILENKCYNFEFENKVEAYKAELESLNELEVKDAN